MTCEFQTRSSYRSSYQQHHNNDDSWVSEVSVKLLPCFLSLQQTLTRMFNSKELRDCKLHDDDDKPRIPAISMMANAPGIMDGVHLYSSGIDTHDTQSRPSKALLNSLTNSSKLSVRTSFRAITELTQTPCSSPPHHHSSTHPPIVTATTAQCRL